MSGDLPVAHADAGSEAASRSGRPPADGPGAGLPGGGLPGLLLSRAEVDRSTVRRGDSGWLAAAWADPATRVLVVEDGKALVRSGGGAEELVFVSPHQAPDGVRFLLGTGTDETVYFGVTGPLPQPAGEAGGPAPAQAQDVAEADAVATSPVGLRQAGPLLSDRDAGLMTHAVALANWHSVYGHCPRCGAVTEPEMAGHSRRCVADGSEHFPRLDPAAIMLVTDPDDRALLARNAQWPLRRVSILAGFVEPGESAEQAVAREVLEETGIVVGDISYVGSQPWPMPRSLMLGFRAQAAGHQVIRVDEEEIAEAGWYSRDDLRGMIAAGDIRLPPPVSIAHRIIESWYGSELGGAW